MAEKPSRAEEERAQGAHRLKKLKSFLVKPETLRTVLRILSIVRIIGRFMQTVAEFLG